MGSAFYPEEKCKRQSGRAARGARVAIAAATALAVLIGSGCETLERASSNSDCVTHENGFEVARADEGQLAQTVLEDGPFPMAIIVSQDALNRIFSAVADAELPPIELVDDPLGLPVTLNVYPEFPLIQVGGELGCAECLLTELAFGLGVSINGGDEVRGTGLGRYQFPLATVANGLESTHVIAQLAQSSVLQIDFDIDGVDSAIMDAFSPLVSDALTLLIRDQFGDTELFELEAWKLGDGDVRLLGRGPIIDADARTVVLGMHSNLIRPLDGTVQLDTTLPSGVDIGMQFHPELVQRMVQRMMFEGHVPRSYDFTGQPASDGDHQITLRTMQEAPNGLLTTGFTLWRTGGGFCGFANFQADLGLSISDRAIQLQAENIEVTDGVGAGELLVAADSWYDSRFTDDVINVSELTINYREMHLPNEKQAELGAETFELNLDGRGLSVFLNIDAIVDSTD